MNAKNWGSPVKFKGISGTTIAVSSPEDALRCLMDDWPPGEKLKTKTAVRLCLDAVAGECPVAEARRAFVEACQEAELGAHSKH